MAEADDASNSLFNRSIAWIIGITIVTVLIGILVAVVITRGLLKQLGGEPDYAAEIADHIAKGDLAIEISIKDGDKGSLLMSMKEMRDNLARIVGQIREGAHTIASASTQIASGNADLSARTEEQAGSLEETASAMEELTATVQRNADNAQQANTLGATASTVAVKGGSVVGQVVETMSSINESSRKIVDIISEVDGIAFQTNILALNAAVEAARAGEIGRGFAVVAAEVRVLAQRVAAASKESQTLITDSVSKVESCDKQVLLAGTTMRKIVSSVSSAATIMQEISSASREQSSGVATINDTIAQLDQMTQENAKLVDEISAAAANLHRQAVTLTNVVSHFDLGSDEFGTREDAMTLVDSAIEHAEAEGLPSLVDKVNDLVERRFADRDLYLVVVGLADGQIVAHGGNPRLVGVDTRKHRDPGGKPFGQEIVDTARNHGTGWVDFKFAHPVTQEIKTKSAYVRRLGDCLVSCGFYTR